MNRMATAGSVRSMSQSKDLMGDFEEASYEGTGNARTMNYTKDGNAKSFNMNKHVNYTDSDMP
jgi:hypothetical protein